MNQSMVDIDIRLENTRSFLFDKKYMRKAMTAAGREVRDEARRLVNKSGSGADDYPGKVTGRLSRSINYKVSRPGFLVLVQPNKTAAFGNKEFYPAFLHHGVRVGGRKKNHRKRTDNAAYRIAPRKNYMADALANKSGRVRQLIADAIRDGVKAG